MWNHWTSSPQQQLLHLLGPVLPEYKVTATGCQLTGWHHKIVIASSRHWSNQGRKVFFFCQLLNLGTRTPWARKQPTAARSWNASTPLCGWTEQCLRASRGWHPEGDTPSELPARQSSTAATMVKPAAPCFPLRSRPNSVVGRRLETNKEFHHKLLISLSIICGWVGSHRFPPIFHLPDYWSALLGWWVAPQRSLRASRISHSQVFS